MDFISIEAGVFWIYLKRDDISIDYFEAEVPQPRLTSSCQIEPAKQWLLVVCLYHEEIC